MSDGWSDQATLRRERAAAVTAMRTCVGVAVLAAVAGVVTYAHGWRSGWPPGVILAVVAASGMVHAVTSVAFDVVLRRRLAVEMALTDAELRDLLGDGPELPAIGPSPEPR